MDKYGLVRLIYQSFNISVTLYPEIFGAKGNASNNDVNKRFIYKKTMGKIYHKLYYHVAWSTAFRQEIISPEIENVLYAHIESYTRKLKCFIYGIGGTEDHIHIAITIPPGKSISDVIGKIKGSSSYHLNHELKITKDFSWQGGFGAVSFSEKDLKKILFYIKNQKQHHATGTTNSTLEQMSNESEEKNQYS